MYKSNEKCEFETGILYKWKKTKYQFDGDDFVQIEEEKRLDFRLIKCSTQLNIGRLFCMNMFW